MEMSGALNVQSRTSANSTDGKENVRVELSREHSGDYKWWVFVSCLCRRVVLVEAMWIEVRSDLAYIAYEGSR